MQTHSKTGALGKAGDMVRLAPPLGNTWSLEKGIRDAWPSHGPSFGHKLTHFCRRHCQDLSFPKTEVGEQPALPMGTPFPTTQLPGWA